MGRSHISIPEVSDLPVFYERGITHKYITYFSKSHPPSQTVYTRLGSSITISSEEHSKEISPTSLTFRDGIWTTVLPRNIYTPHGDWAWADGLSMKEVVQEMKLPEGIMCSASVKRGTLGNRRIQYICKSWAIDEKWEGFFSELALYKCQLKPLQGKVVPNVIGVYTSPNYVNVAMETPHPSFWIEASADMPNVLKKRCVEAFEQIHAQGVLHGDVELRHMLIGGDGRVTVIDFQASRALVPNEQVELRRADSAELRKEMRKVKFKLDFENARTIEQQRMARHFSRKKDSKDTNYVLDVEDSPIDAREWSETWVYPGDVEPKRYVMPGQTSQQLEEAIQRFLTLVDHMSRDSSTSECTPLATVPHKAHTASSPVIANESLPMRRYSLRLRSHVMQHSRTGNHLEGSPKRKSSPLDEVNVSSAKRLRIAGSVHHPKQTAKRLCGRNALSSGIQSSASMKTVLNRGLRRSPRLHPSRMSGATLSCVDDHKSRRISVLPSQRQRPPGRGRRMADSAHTSANQDSPHRSILSTIGGIRGDSQEPDVEAAYDNHDSLIPLAPQTGVRRPTAGKLSKQTQVSQVRRQIDQTDNPTCQPGIQQVDERSNQETRLVEKRKREGSLDRDHEANESRGTKVLKWSHESGEIRDPTPQTSPSPGIRSILKKYNPPDIRSFEMRRIAEMTDGDEDELSSHAPSITALDRINSGSMSLEDELSDEIDMLIDARDSDEHFLSGYYPSSKQERSSKSESWSGSTHDDPASLGSPSPATLDNAPSVTAITLSDIGTSVTATGQTELDSQCVENAHGKLDVSEHISPRNPDSLQMEQSCGREPHDANCAINIISPPRHRPISSSLAEWLGSLFHH